MERNYLSLAVAGLHLKGQPLSYQLETLGAEFVKTCFTSSNYKMYLLDNGKVKKPGLVRLPEGQNGSSFEIDIWSLPINKLGNFLLLIPPPLGLGTLFLEDGMQVKGFISESIILEEGIDISQYAGWRAYLKSLE